MSANAEQAVDFDAKREALRQRYLAAPDETGSSTAGITRGVDHLALICSDLEATIEFYVNVVEMRLTKVIANRDEPTSTHIFLDMGGGNQLAFFDFPNHGPAPTVRGVGAMHHLAMKADPAKFQRILVSLERHNIEHSRHGSGETGSVYFRDPDNILLEVTTGYD